ncbi:MAG: hypothetical protein KC449_09955, partial [Anaerolineales bacterium]|nr:hypothetical protein [Anaerolineales bacterium]
LRIARMTIIKRTVPIETSIMRKQKMSSMPANICRSSDGISNIIIRLAISQTPLPLDALLLREPSGKAL